MPTPAPDVRKGDLVVCEAGDVIPTDGEIVEGIASVDESAMTGESAPVIRESGGDRSSVTGGTRVLSDRIVIRVTADPGETFLDRMILLVEGAIRQRTPNEIALSILLAGLSIVFVVVCAALPPMAHFASTGVTLAVLAALFVALIPTTIGALLSAIGIAGMNRLVQKNVLATSGRAVEAAGDVSVLLLDKTGTITLGNRQATRFVPVGGRRGGRARRGGAAQLARRRDARGALDRRAREGAVTACAAAISPDTTRSSSPFTAETRMSGVDLDGRRVPQGRRRRRAARRREAAAARCPPISRRRSTASRARGATPLVVSEGARVLGVIELKDIVKEGIKERFDQLRAAGIRTVMITGDNPLTAAAIAAESGVDEFLAEATPENKLALIRKEQEGGQLVAMTGDGTNDAPALAQADVGVAMNAGTQAAKEAGNMVDLDSNPTKLLDVVAIGKQMLITRGALTTFSIANDLAKYFAIIPALFVLAYPQLNERQRALAAHARRARSSLRSSSTRSSSSCSCRSPCEACSYVPSSASALLRRNVLLYGVGGVIAPFIGIKLIDILLGILGY